MAALQATVQFFLDLGASVFLPIVIFALAVAFGARPGKAARSALFVGVGFVGINVVLGILFDRLGPASEAMVARFGFELDVIDVGWPAAAAIAFGSDIAVLIIPAGIALNVLLLATRVTRTLNVDIWNYWHFAFVGALVQATTGNIWWGLASAMLFSAAVLFLADWTAPATQRLLGIPGVSLPHGFSAPFVIPAIALNRVIDAVPGLRRVQGDPEAIRTRFGVVGEPVVQGSIIGLVIALIAFAGAGPAREWIPAVLQTAISLAAVMVLMPRVISLLMEGLIPLSEVVRDFLRRRFSGREIYIGIDAAVAIGHPTSIAASLVMVPITLVLAVVLPGNRVLPFGDLATIPFLVVMMVPVVRGNVFRAIIVSTVVMVPTIYVMNAMASLHTEVALAADFAIPADAAKITSLVDGGSWLAALFALAAEHFWLGHALLLAVLALAWVHFTRNRAAWHAAAGAARESDREEADAAGAPDGEATAVHDHPLARFAHLLEADSVIVDLPAATRDEALTAMARLLVERGDCHPTFVGAILAREAVHPSGLPMEGPKIAIPHTDASHVRRSAILFARLERPVAFRAMGAPDEELDVRLIAMLALHADEPIGDLLEALITVFQDGAVLDDLLAAGDAATIAATLQGAVESLA